jgi:hypothetical protein
VRRFESNPVVIENAAERQLLLLKTLQNGPRGQFTQRLMNEVSTARICLLDARKRAEYDAILRPPAASRPADELGLKPEEDELGLKPDDDTRDVDEFSLLPPPSEPQGNEFRLEPAEAERRAQELRLAPEDADCTTQELIGPAHGDSTTRELIPPGEIVHPVDQPKPQRRVVNRWAVSGPLPPEQQQRPAAASLPALTPLPSEELVPLGPTSRRRLKPVSTTRRKPALSKVPRSAPAGNPSIGNILVMLGGIGVGVYIGATLILMWFYGDSSRSQPVPPGPGPDDPAAVSTDAETSGSKLIRKPTGTSPAERRTGTRPSKFRSESMSTRQTGELATYGTRR